MNITSEETMHTQIDVRSITPNRAYRVPEIATAMHTGPRSVYRAIQSGKLRAATINDRGDLRVLGSWALAYLEAMAGSQKQSA